MDIKALYGFTLLLLLIGMVLGVGVLMMDKFGVATYNTARAPIEQLTNVNTVNYTALTYPTADITSYNYTAFNATNAVSLQCNNRGKWDCTAVKIIDGSAINNTNVNISYYYGASSVASAALVNVRTEISAISTTWLGLIVTVAILSIVLMVVLSSFGGFRGRD